MTQKKQDLFQQTEGKLYWYYEAERELDLMRGMEERISTTKTKLMGLKDEYIEACAYQGAKAQYASEHVQGKKSIYSNPIEPAVNAMEGMRNEIDLLCIRQTRITGDIFRKEAEAAVIRLAIGYLNGLDKDICEYKYRYHMSLDEIARHVNLSVGAIRARREKIVQHVADRLKTFQLRDMP